MATTNYPKNDEIICIVRQKDYGYTVIENDIIDDCNITPEAGWLYMTILRYGQIDPVILKQKINMDDDAFAAAWDLLITLGYLQTVSEDEREGE